MGILWAVVALVGLGLVVGIVHYVQSRRRAALGLVEEEPVRVATDGCCGMHMTCERDSLLAAVSTSIVYYDDEELDAYRGVSAQAYTSSAVEAFREVLITLDLDDVAGWVRSLQLRGIELPEELLPEVFLIIGENRAYHMEHGPGDRH